MSRMCKKCVNCEFCENYDQEMREECIKFDYIHFEKVHYKKKLDDMEE